MRRSVRLCGGIAVMVAAATVALASPSGAADGGRPFSTSLTGAAEAPGPGDPDGSGMAVLAINPGQEEVCYTLTVENVDDVVAAHIHRAPVGEPGSVVIPLAAPTTGSSSDCALADRALLKEIVRAPDGFYVNVHSSEHPDGAVRGQLSR